MDEARVRSLAVDAIAGIAPEANLSSIGDGEDLREALDLDSMDFMNFVIAVSQRCGRDIPESDTPRLRTMGGLIEYLRPVAD